MAMEAHPISLPSNIPPGNFASKLIKAIHGDSRNHVLPADGRYPRKSSMSSSRRGAGEWPKNITVQLPLEHPLEGRNNPQPTKAFMHWKVPRRYSREMSSQEHQLQTDNERAKSAASRISRLQHGPTQTTHFAPPQGQFEPVMSEQQEHMAEILQKRTALEKHLQEKALMLPSIARSAPTRRVNSETSELLTLEPRTYSAAQRWLKRNPGKEEIAKKVLRQTGRTEVDKVLEHTLQPDAKKAVREWLKSASEEDRQTALKFFQSLGGRKLLGGPSGHNPNRNVVGGRDARLKAVVGALQNSTGQAHTSHRRYTTEEEKLTSLMTAAHRRHLRLLSPDTRIRHMEYQTWHHMPVYPYPNRVENILSAFTTPRALPPRTFAIHPEWGA